MKGRIHFYPSMDTGAFLQERGPSPSNTINAVVSRYSAMLSEQLPVLPWNMWHIVFGIIPADKKNLSPHLVRSVIADAMKKHSHSWSMQIANQWTESNVIAVLDAFERLQILPFEKVIPKENISE